MKRCEPCDGTGLVDEIKLKPVIKKEDVVGVGTTLEDIFPGVTKALGGEVATRDLSEDSDNFPKPTIKIKKKANKQPIVSEPIFNGYSDAMMVALLAEPTMNSEDWKKKYPEYAGMGIRERQSIRTMYAQSKPVGVRQVDLGRAQDSAVKSDPEYVAYQAKERALLEKKAGAKDNKKKKSGIGGM